jgi:molybdenum cofactor cytidylyltransferase
VTTSPQPIAIILLAAGQSSRFGSSKMQATINGQPLLKHALHTFDTLLGALSDCNLTVVLGPNQTALQALTGEHRTVVCHDANMGIGHSISYGVRQALKMHKDTQGLMIALADQVAITSKDYRKLVHVFQQGKQLVAARYHGVYGAPAIFDRRYASELMSLRGDQGARRVLKEHATELTTVAIASAALDIDTPQDLQHYLQSINTG